jgi:small subunit ribosomal protein S15
MYARRRGKSGSTRRPKQKAPEWVPLTAAEVEELIVKMHGEGLSTAQIGVRLRDQHGVPQARLITGRSVLQTLHDKGVKLEVPEDLGNLMKTADRLAAHLRGNPSDIHNRRSLQLTESKIHRLKNYYKSEGLLPADWQYSGKLAELREK